VKALHFILPSSIIITDAKKKKRKPIGFKHKQLIKKMKIKYWILMPDFHEARNAYSNNDYYNPAQQ
jgi:hypothetical protein